MPEAKAFWLLQIMDEIRPFPRYNGNWLLMNPLKLVCVGNGQISLFVSTHISYGKNSAKQLLNSLLQSRRSLSSHSGHREPQEL